MLDLNKGNKKKKMSVWKKMFFWGLIGLFIGIVFVIPFQNDARELNAEAAKREEILRETNKKIEKGKQNARNNSIERRSKLEENRKNYDEKKISEEEYLTIQSEINKKYGLM